MTTKPKTRRQVNERAHKLLRKKAALAKGNQPDRCRAYLDFIKTLPCVECWPEGWSLVMQGKMPIPFFREYVNKWNGINEDGKTEDICGPVDPAHIGPHAYGRKGSDFTCIPRGRRHHEQLGSKPPEGIDYKALVAKLREAYEAQK